MALRLLRLGVLLFVCASSGRRVEAQAAYAQKPTPKTVAWCYYDAGAAPDERLSHL